ncbi:hypothetical protein LOTGIDRAFT_234457 [Lottia gigantea]|uniref:Uncharacterized protein n=1 Tax=Lottia gigantea TaxID=225164 RepID=V4A5L2_LOTGI|nr:hypothetical protein LOTGIDRAFT_234457 [Lottia gigantea]ESO88546.1 hypothetical protein LOTGIDRAFT_234457 [Lottia gigantea]
MFGDREKQLGVWSPKTIKIHDGLHGTGPVVLFDKNDNAILIAPFTNPLTMSTNYNKTDHSLSWGIMGGVDEVPPGYTISTIIVYSENGGINDVFDKYGKLVQYYFDKQIDYQPADITLSHLGYWTDNGGYYYYHTEPKKNYEDTILDIKKDIDRTKIPYRYMQLDSWWYYKDKNQAVTRWEPRPDIFPDGLQKLQEKLNLPLSLHNRYWSKDTPYAAKYLFLKGVGLSVPLTTKFWDFLFTRGKTWGMKMYEQFMFLEKMKSNLTLATTWLDSMATSAENNGMSIQYCMTQSRMAFQSLQYSPVTQARVSDDYHLLDDQWKIGISSLFAHAMGVRPSKDTFWTTTKQPGNPFNTTEPYPALQTLLAVLSTGPVGPSDGINYTNTDLLMKCCNADGLILKPSKPATAIDDDIIEKAIRDGSGAKGEVYSTYSDFGEYIKQRYGIIVVANLSQAYNITPSKASFTVNINNFPESVIYDSANISNTVPFTEDKPYTLPVCLLTATNYCLYYTSPVLYIGNNSKIVIYGETNKFVPMSQQRVFKFWIDANSLAVTIRGFPNENVTFVYSVDDMIKTTYNIIDQKTQCATVTLFGKPNIPSGIDCTYTQPTPKSRPKHKPFEKQDYAFRIRDSRRQLRAVPNLFLETGSARQ